MSRLRYLIPTVALLGMLAVVGPAAAADFLVFRVKVALQLRQVIIGGATDTIVKAKLKERDIVNLALGRPLGTKVDKKTEVLAVALDPSAPLAEPLARVMVFDPAQGGLAGITTVVAETTELDFDAADVKRGTAGQGAAMLEIQETTLGTPAEHALETTTLLVTGTGKAPVFVPPGLDLKLTLKGELGGRVSFRSDGEAFSGFIVKGKGSVSGKPIGSFSE